MGAATMNTNARIIILAIFDAFDAGLRCFGFSLAARVFAAVVGVLIDYFLLDFFCSRFRAVYILRLACLG
jgi:hypothetical protein